MFDFLKKKTQKNAKTTLKITGMHCPSCAMNIDGALEELEGIVSASTNYARSEFVVEYIEEKVELPQVKKTIVAQGYKIIED